jgi:hypothetical protein
MGKMWKELGFGLLRLALAVVIGSIVGSLLFGALDFLRTFQSDSNTLSVARHALGIDAPLYQRTNAVTPFDPLIAQFVDWYSTTFFGYSRFGAGLFMLAAAFWSLGAAKEYSAAPRIVVGFFAGVLMGTRMAMFVLSRPDMVLGIALVAGIWCAVFMWLAGRPSKFKPLPKLQFKHQA